MLESPPRTAETAPARDVYTVSRLNREARLLLETSLPLLWVEGEISNLARPSSGHLYFSLKDAAAQVRCAMFRLRNQYLAFTPKDGMQVLARVRVSLYEGRGEFQLIVEHMEEAGDGALRRAFDELKRRLAAEGLFEEARKRPLPPWPRRIGVITSPTGAAIRDILSVLRRRFPSLPVLLYPVPVQGAGAGAEIARRIRQASQRAECDVLILARGGGSLEDLWAFNEEVVARAVHDCAIPVVVGVGHEIDFTIADFVADRRAPTPSAAAELVSPNGEECLERVLRLEARLLGLTQDRFARKGEHLGWLVQRLQQQHPGQRLQRRAQRLDEIEQRLLHAQRAHLRHARARLGELTAQLHRYLPIDALARLEARRENLAQRLHNALQLALERRRQRLAAAGRALDTVSPLATLGRGYAIVTRAADGTVVRAAREVEIGERVAARLAEGSLLCRVEDQREEE
jgi:exodeoxyribonuclease VII large subunit